MPTASSIDRLRSHLLFRIHRRYRTVAQRVLVSSELGFEFRRIANPDTVLDEVAEEESRLEKLSGRRVPADQLHLPYWAELWDSAMGLARHLTQISNLKSQISDLILGLNVLDLGCGMGLAGTAAAAMGHRVLFADLEPPALLFAALNSLPWRDRVRTRRLNWQIDSLNERFDIILGADILYERQQWAYLLPFWRKHLADGGQVILGEPGRQTGDLFIDWIKTQGWKLEQFEQAVSTRPRPIRIFTLTQS